MRMSRKTAGLALAFVVAGLIPGSASASHCDDQMVVFSGVAGGPKVNTSAVICIAGVEELGDTRIINPGSNEISIRHTADFGAAVPEIVATLNGLGFTNREVVLKRAPGTTGGFYYNSAPMPLNATARGCLVVELAPLFGGAEAGNTRFHTTDSSCP